MKKNYKLILNILPFLICIMLLTSCSKTNNSFNRPSMPMEVGVEAFTIKPQNIKKTISCTGEFISPQSAFLTSEIMGVITYLDIPEGREVKSGHIIAKIEDSITLADLKAEEAKLENSEEDFKRIKTLYNEGAVSKQFYDKAFEDFRVHKALYERAKSIQSKNIISTPFSGILSLKRVSLGEYINSGDSIVKITQISPLNLVFSIPEKYLNDLSLNQIVNFTTTSNEMISTVIDAIDPNIDNITRTIKVQSMVQNDDLNLLPGSFANVEVGVKNNPSNILIPEEAVINEGQEKIVYLITSLNNVLPKKIIISKWEDGFAEVSSGLKIGDKVVTSGHQKLFPGAMVIVSDYVPIRNTFVEHGHPE